MIFYQKNMLLNKVVITLQSFQNLVGVLKIKKIFTKFLNLQIS
jgi:hypothetical protein